ncbi:hypothetical protein BEH94_04500, partial [Candidatus Altiarchaeales archaeon WOR_SM1_SCG]
SIIGGKFGMEKDERIEQAVRTALAILTEGVVAAPIEGIAKVEVNQNPDNTNFLSIYFSGPIRSAGGTAQGLAVLIGAYIQKKLKYRGFRPTGDIIERYIEEIRLYNDTVTNLQYVPGDEEIRLIVKNSGVCIDGEPTEKDKEVAVHRDISGVHTNLIRGGMCLVIAEGMAQKAPKLMKKAADFGIDWSFLEEVEKLKIGKKSKETGDGKDNAEKLKPIAKFMKETVGGRPIFAAPSERGAFRLRYGRSRASGIAAKSIHPAAQVLLGEFIATGTQVRVERPGKGCIITPCDTIEGPVVKLKTGDVVRVETVEYAKKIKNKISEILFLGDILVSYGDFLQTNHQLVPSGYCEEWWVQELKAAGGDFKGIPTPGEALEISEKFNIPLHPRYTYHWEDISFDELKILYRWFSMGEVKGDVMRVANKKEEKRILELSGILHVVSGNFIEIPGYVILKGLFENIENIEGGIEDSGFYSSAYEFLNKNSGIKIRKKVGTYIGARMGRPEKAKERKMQPAVHLLFPISDKGGRERSINVAVGATESSNDKKNNYPNNNFQTMSTSTELASIEVDVPRYECECGNVSVFTRCGECGREAKLKKNCPNTECQGKRVWDEKMEKCPSCKTRLRFYEKRDVQIGKLWKEATDNAGAFNPVKCVKGMISAYKIPEHIEKGILRARNNVFVFKDGTVRFDATDAPLTHFKPKEIGVEIKNLNKLGYYRDYNNCELKDENQVVELNVQDIIIPLNGAEYLMRTAKFVDELLSKFYNVSNFYNIRTKEDLLGHLVVGLAPHTSAGIMGRIAGFTNARVCYAHPYWHAAKRRNCFAADTKIPVLENGEWKLIPIKKLVEDNLFTPKKDDFGTLYSRVKELKTLSFNLETGEFEISEISHVSRHAPQKTITLKTKSGRIVTTTHDHPFPTKNGKKAASEIEEVFVPKNFTEKLIKNWGGKTTRVAEGIGGVFVDKIVNKKLNEEEEVYSLTVPQHHTVIANGIVSHQCDGDEDTIMLLMDVLLNFSKKFLPASRGGKMDAPLVITTLLDPKEVDDEAHKMEIVDNYSLKFYEETLHYVNPADVDVGMVNDLLNNNPYSNLRFTHDTGNITGPVVKSRYVTLKTMTEKVDAQLAIAEKVRAIDERKVAEILINSHFLRDTYGNLRAFSRQKFRCVKCNQSYRRVPLVGKCTKCGGRLLLTVTEGSVRKYLDISRNMAEKYGLSDYLKQRLMLLDRDIKSLFVNDLSKQVALSDFM